MNCSETKTFFAEWERMCGTADIKTICPLIKKDIADGCAHCEDYVRRNIDKAIETVQEWSDTHPIKTRLSVFLEQYPNVVLNEDNGLPAVCVGTLYGINKCIYDVAGNRDCVMCWNTPIKEL